MSGIGEREDAPEVEVFEDDSAHEANGNDDGGEEGGDEPDDQDEQSDEVGDEPADGGEGHPAVGAAKPRSAATIAVQEAKRKAKAAEERAEAAERRTAEFERERQGQRTVEQQRLEQERVALMAPEEKTEYLLHKQQQEFNGRFGALEFRMQDAADRTGFESLCARVPAYQSVRDAVEAKLSEARKQGGNPNRETVAKFIIGENAVARALRGGSAKQAAKGAARIAAQTTKPVSGRGDVPGGERRGGSDRAARAARLGDMEI